MDVSNVLESGLTDEIKDTRSRLITPPGPLKGMTVRVNHLSLLVRDAKVSARFYTTILGAIPLNRPAFPGPGYWLWLGNIQLHLIQAQKEADVAAESMHAEGLRVGAANHFALEVADFDSVERFLKEHGVHYQRTFVPAGLDGLSAVRQLFFPDPDGHFVEVCECDRLNPFVFGGTQALNDANKIANRYLEGVQPPGFLAVLTALTSWSISPSQIASGDGLGTMATTLGASQTLFLHLTKDRDASPPRLPISDLISVIMRFARAGPLFSTPFRLDQSLTGSSDSPVPWSSSPSPLSYSLRSSFGTPPSTPLLVSRDILAQLSRFASDGLTLSPEEFTKLILFELSSPTLKQELFCGFSLIATPVGDAGLSIKYLDFALAMGKLRFDTDDTKLRASFSTLVDPDDQMGVSFEKFLQLLPREI